MDNGCRLKTAKRGIPWQQRLRDIAIAGGAVALAGCAAGLSDDHRPRPDATPWDGPGPCGNANPDPCTNGCGTEAACAATTACIAQDGAWSIESDGGILCTILRVGPEPVPVEGGGVPAP